MTKPKVFCVGLGKTGTSTFALCMTKLGRLHRTGPGAYGLLRLKRGDTETLLDLAARYDSVDDFPYPYLYRELAEHFPDARFVLTVRRNTETWLHSVCRHHERAGDSLERRLAYGHRSPYDDLDAHRQLYEAHNAAVQDYFAGTGRLRVLSWDRGDGWDELCEFLDEPIPDQSFPHRNASAQKSPARTVERLVRKGKWDHAERFCHENREQHPELQDRLAELLAPEDIRRPELTAWKQRLRRRRWIRE